MKESEAYRLFDMLLPIFESNILTTHRCKYVQFLLFYLCTKDTQRLPTRFIDRLTELALDPQEPLVLRQSALAYLASFLARFKTVTGRTVAKTLDSLCESMEDYLENVEKKNIDEGVNSDRGIVPSHLIFFSVCQAVYYVVAFHHSTVGGEDILEGKDKCSVRLRERLRRLTGCSLKPLEHCLESVRKEFLRLAHVKVRDRSCLILSVC